MSTAHYELVVVHKRTPPRRDVREREIARCGGLVHIITDHNAAARKLSRLPWVDRVVATLVYETHVGTWRDGKKV